MRLFLAIGLCLLTVGGAYACMPHSPYEVVMGKFGGITTGSDVEWMADLGVLMSDVDFPFVDKQIGHEFRPLYWSIDSGIVLPEVDDVIVMLATYRDGNHIHDYTIDSYAAVSCEDDVLRLGSTYGHHLARNRRNGSCRDARPVHLLDGFVHGDGDAWLGRLQELYPTCRSFDQKFSRVFVDDGIDTLAHWWTRFVDWLFGVFNF